MGRNIADDPRPDKPDLPQNLEELVEVMTKLAGSMVQMAEQCIRIGALDVAQKVLAPLQSAPSGRAIDRDSIYSAEEVCEILEISPNTLAGWGENSEGHSHRLVATRPGTKKNFYFGDEIIEYMRTRRDGATAAVKARRKPRSK